MSEYHRQGNSREDVVVFLAGRLLTLFSSFLPPSFSFQLLFVSILLSFSSPPLPSSFFLQVFVVFPFLLSISSIQLAKAA